MHLYANPCVSRKSFTPGESFGQARMPRTVESPLLCLMRSTYRASCATASKSPA